LQLHIHRIEFIYQLIVLLMNIESYYWWNNKVTRERYSCLYLYLCQVRDSNWRKATYHKYVKFEFLIQTIFLYYM